MQNKIQERLDRTMTKFYFEEAQWVQETVIKPLLWQWVDRIIIDVVQYRKYGAIGRLFHFCVEYFYLGKYQQIRIARNKSQSFVGGKGFRPGNQKIKLDRIRSTVFLKGKEVATKEFPINITY